MTWIEISGFHFGWNYGKRRGFVELTFSEGDPEFIDNLESIEFNILLDLLRHNAKYFDKNKKVISQTQELPPEKKQPPIIIPRVEPVEPPISRL